LENWFEPPAVHGAHYSTLVQQLLSSIAQYGGLQATQAFRLLCAPPGPFERVSKDAFAELLHTLGQQEILTQDHSGLLLHGRVGDKIVNHYSFYAAFSSDEEFRIVSGGKALGTLPVSQMMTSGQRILFGGRTWLIETIDEEHKTIHVAPAKGGAPPLFNGAGGRVHTQVRERMRDIYVAQDALPFLDPTAQRFLREGREAFVALALADRLILDQGSQAILLTWLGDAANEAIACLLMSRGVRAFTGRLGIEIQRAGRSLEEIENLLRDVASEPAAPVDELLAKANNLARQKWDGLLSSHLLRQSYASSNLDLDEALAWLRVTFESRH